MRKGKMMHRRNVEPRWHMSGDTWYIREMGLKRNFVVISIVVSVVISAVILVVISAVIWSAVL